MRIAVSHSRAGPFTSVSLAFLCAVTPAAGQGVCRNMLQPRPEVCGEPPPGEKFQAVYDAVRTANPLDPRARQQLMSSSPDDSAAAAAKTCLRTALIDQGNQVWRRYIEGDEIPPREGIYRCGAALYDAALEFLPDSERAARAKFFRGLDLLADPSSEQTSPSGAQSVAERLARASDIFSQIIVDSPSNDPARTQYHIARGKAFLAQGRYEEAKADFSKSIQITPTAFYPRHFLGLILIETGQYQDALQKYESLTKEAGLKAKRANPAEPNLNDIGYLHYNYALLLHRLKNLSGAEEEYEKASAIFSAKAGKFRSEKDLELARAFEERLADTYNALGALSVSLGNQQKGKENYCKALGLSIDRCDTDFEKSDLSGRPYSATRHNLGLLFFRQKDPAMAVKIWEYNIKTDPNYLPSHLVLANYYASKNQYVAAIKHYREVLQHNPEFQDALLGLRAEYVKLGDSYAAQGETAKACESYGKALEQDAGDTGQFQLNHRQRKLCPDTKRKDSTVIESGGGVGRKASDEAGSTANRISTP